MKALHKIKNLPFLVFGVGLVEVLLRVTLYAVGADQRGLIGNYHPLHLLCVLLAAATAVHIALTVRRADISLRVVNAGRNAIVLPILAAVWFLSNGFAAMDLIRDRLDAVRAALAFTAVPCVLFAGWFQYKRVMPHFGFHGFLTAFFAIDMICRYRIWSGNPQLVDYFFQLLACVFLTLTAYYQTAFSVGLGNRRNWLFCNLMAALFCMPALIGVDDMAFYVGGLLWAISGICLPEPLDNSYETEEA